jgi:hypothetical protein
MIVFDLCCDKNHLFEGWFKDREAYTVQKRKGLIACPICGSNSVQKVPSAVAVHTKSTVKTNKTPEVSVNKVLNKIYSLIIQNTEDVGQSFAQEAFKMHYGVSEKRNIRGIATAEEEKILNEEGISFMKIPVPRKNSTKGH